MGELICPRPDQIKMRLDDSKASYRSVLLYA